jgi:hypothetical protein
VGLRVQQREDRVRVIKSGPAIDMSVQSDFRRQAGALGEQHDMRLWTSCAQRAQSRHPKRPRCVTRDVRESRVWGPLSDAACERCQRACASVNVNVDRQARRARDARQR